MQQSLSGSLIQVFNRPLRRARPICIDRSQAMDIDRPDIVAEVTAAFERYEHALVTNDAATLNPLFRADARTIRYGSAEILYGHDEIAAFRAARSPVGLARRRPRTGTTTRGGG